MKNLNLSNNFLYVRAISGLFISEEYPSGVTPTEIKIFSVLWGVMQHYEENKITPRVKLNAAELLTIDLQIITNYVAKLKKKRLVNKDSTLNSLFSKPGIKIELSHDSNTNSYAN